MFARLSDHFIRRSRMCAALAGAGVVSLALLGCQKTAAPGESGSASAPQPPASFVQPEPSKPSAPLVVGLPDFTPLVDKVGPSVVNIRVMEKVGRSPLGGVDPMEELLRRFFGIRPDQMPKRNQPQPDGNNERPSGVGSGFIISADGYIMTNAHVVDEADSLVVTLTDKREFKAKVVGKDKRTDVAVVKIEAQGLPVIQAGSVQNLKVGQWVLAIGSPFGLDNTVTAGIVSAMQRDTGEYLPFIQTDVAVNPGNSGGPLINMSGEVVGINSQIYSRSGGFMGISFAIPIDEAMRVAEQLRTSGSVTRGRIGVQIAPVGKEVAESMGLPGEQGALVRAVEPGAPAEKAGVQAGDVITKVDGKTINRTSDLPRMIGEIKPGTQAVLTVLRNGSTRDITVTVARAEEEGQKPLSGQGGQDSTPDPAAPVNALGLQVVDVPAAQLKQLRVSGGVLVQGVAAGSRAENAGLQEGDVILALGNQQVQNVEAFNAAVKALPAGRPATVLYQREGMAQYGIIRP